jgi:hypothetical protein
MTSLATIESSKFTVSRSGIEFHEDLTFDEWNSIGVELVPMAKAIGFVVGDWLNYGEKRYGEKYVKAIRLTGLAIETLKVYSHVARNVEKLLRNNFLDFHHHKVVAKLKDTEEKRRWLDIAERDKMSVTRLRKSINAGRPLTPDEVRSDPAERGRATHLSILNELRRWWMHENEKLPVAKWDRDHRAALKADFKLILDIYKAL